MLNRWGEHYSERGKKASSKYGRLRAKELKREAEFRLEDKDGLMYVVPRHGDVDYDVPTCLRRNPDFQRMNNL